MLRPMILGIVGKFGDQDVINEAKKRFERHIAGDLIDPNIREDVYIIVSRYGDESTQEALRKVMKTIFKLIFVFSLRIFSYTLLQI